MPYRPFTDQNCSVAAALSLVGERWTLLIMRDVLLGRRRFADIKRSTGVASNILESYEYVPTRKGLDLNPVIVALMQWGDRYNAPEAGPPRIPVHTVCGHDAHPQMHCSHCGEAIASGELNVRPGPGASQRQIYEGVLPKRA
jgi:DNA-binding HxlR family transcriptional regulator